MNPNEIRIRLMESDDFDAIMRIDTKVLGHSRSDYYEQKFELLFKSGEYLPTSLVAETADNRVVGFIMGELYIGEFGISRQGATVDTVGVDPDFQRTGIGKRLMDEFLDHLRHLNVTKIHTLVDKGDTGLIQYFNANQFSPSQNIINLERTL